MIFFLFKHPILCFKRLFRKRAMSIHPLDVYNDTLKTLRACLVSGETRSPYAALEEELNLSSKQEQ